MIQKATQIRLYPNKAQANDFRRFQGGVRRLWNDMLAATKAQRDATGKFMTKRQLQDFAVAWKRRPETAWGMELPAHAVLQISADMHRAFVNFYERRARFPRFRGRGHRQFSIYAVNQATAFDGHMLKLPKVGWMRWRGGDLPEGRLLWKAERRLRRAQCRLSRRQKGSIRRERAMRAVAAIHRRVRHQRRDMTHQATGRIVRRAGEIRVESLNVRGMAKNRNLAKSVADAGSVPRDGVGTGVHLLLHSWCRSFTERRSWPHQGYRRTGLSVFPRADVAPRSRTRG